MTTNTSPFDTETLSADAAGALSAIDKAGAQAAALVQAWVEAKNADAVAEVAARGQGPARKAARRGLNVLKSRGVAIPERKRVGTIGSQKTETTMEAWMMAPDATGAELFVLVAREGTARGKACMVFLHQRRGVARVESRTLSQSGLREYFDKVLPNAGYKPVKVPVEWARHRIAEARKLHTEANVPEPLGFTAAKDLVEPAPTQPPTHPFDDEGFELADEDAAELAKGSASLHRVAEFRGWLPTQEAMQELLVQVGKKLKAGEEPNPEEVGEHLEAEVRSATDRYFSPQVREQIVQLMKDSALSVLAREGEQRALEVAATLKAVERCGLITDPPQEVPFLRGFFDKAVALMAQQGGGRLRIPVPKEPLVEPEPKADDSETASDETARGEGSPK